MRITQEQISTLGGDALLEKTKVRLEKGSGLYVTNNFGGEEVE